MCLQGGGGLAVRELLWCLPLKVPASHAHGFTAYLAGSSCVTSVLFCEMFPLLIQAVLQHFANSC